MSELSTNTNRLHELLRKLQKEGLRSHETNELGNEIFNMAGINTIARFGAQLDALQAQLASLAETTQTQFASLAATNQAQLEALKESNQALKESNQAQLEALKESNQAQLGALKESNQALKESNQAQLEALGKLLDSRYRLLIWLIAGVGGILTFILTYGTFIAG